MFTGILSYALFSILLIISPPFLLIFKATNMPDYDSRNFEGLGDIVDTRNDVMVTNFPLLTKK